MCLCPYVMFKWMEISEGSWTRSSAGVYQSDVRGQGNLAETKKKNHATESNGFSTLLFSQTTAFLQEQFTETPSLCIALNCLRFQILSENRFPEHQLIFGRWFWGSGSTEWKIRPWPCNTEQRFHSQSGCRSASEQSLFPQGKYAFSLGKHPTN